MRIRIVRRLSRITFRQALWIATVTTLAGTLTIGLAGCPGNPPKQPPPSVEIHR